MGVDEEEEDNKERDGEDRSHGYYKEFCCGFLLLDDLYICWSPAVALVATPPSDIIRLHLFV